MAFWRAIWAWLKTPFVITTRLEQIHRVTQENQHLLRMIYEQNRTSMGKQLRPVGQILAQTPPGQHAAAARVESGHGFEPPPVHPKTRRTEKDVYIPGDERRKRDDLSHT